MIAYARESKYSFWAGLGLIILAGTALRGILLHSFPLGFDEGIHLIWLRLLAAGYQPYTEVYITYPPLYPLAIETVWHLWPGETAQRWFSVAYAILGVVGLALLARHLAGRAAGLAAAALLFFSPTLFEFSRAILGEFPSVAWSIWAVWLAWMYKDGGNSPESPDALATTASNRRLWLVLSAVCLAFSLLTKFLSPFVAGLIPLIMLARWYKNFLAGWRPLLIDLLIWGGVLLAVIVVCVVIFEVGPLLNQVVGQRLEAREAYIEDHHYWGSRYNRSSEFVADDPALFILALSGLGVAVISVLVKAPPSIPASRFSPQGGELEGDKQLIPARLIRRTDLGLLLAWLGLGLVMLLLHSPIRYKHFVILLPPLTILGGLAISAWLKLWFHKRTRLIAATGLILLALLYGWQIPATWHLWQARAAIPQPLPDEAQALDFIQAVTAPDDCVISDNMQLLYWTDRMTPPELAEVSSNRLKSGTLTQPQLMAITDRYDCQLIAPVTNRLHKYAPDYIEWVKNKYLGQFHYNGSVLFFGKADTDPNPAIPVWADFAGKMIFHGYNLPQTPVRPGEQIPLTLVWQAQTDLTTDYTIFVQVRDQANTTLVSGDYQPYLGRIPTSTWPAGAVIPATTWLELPPDIPPGTYPIYVGLYRADNLERLRLINDASGENALILGPLVVE